MRIIYESQFENVVWKMMAFSLDLNMLTQI